MDHISHPKTTSSPLREIPIFAPDTDYDNGPFLGYLKRIKWTVEDIIDVNISPKSRHEVHAVLQRWTYFGIIHEITEVPVTVREFSKVVGGATFLSTHPLPKILNDWAHRESRTSTREKLRRVEHMSQCFNILADVYDTIYIRDPRFLNDDFHLSVQLLYEYIIRATALAYATHHPDNPIPPVRYRDLLGGSKVIGQRMEDLSWCASDIHQLSEIYSATEMVFASLLDRPGPEKDHRNCGSTKCLAYQVTNEEEYKTLHERRGCTCEFVHAEVNTLADVLLDRAGPVPLVGWSEPSRGADGLLHVELKSSKSYGGNVPYVAISHVWSDGLGNNRVNAIPLCQFWRIVRSVAALYNGQKVAFWLDTLCFPLGPKDAYDMALVRMRQSYEDADKVLVFDRYLFEKDSSGMPAEEIAMRIAIGPWNRRLWTLQEGMLARALAFQFRDSVVDPSIWLQQTNNQPATLQSLMFSQVLANYASLRVFETNPSRKMNIIQAKKALTFRSTSQADDEPLCLGNLLGVDPGRVVRAGSRTERMKVIFSSMPRHFSSAIFWASPKLEDHGFRWAPESLMADCGRSRTCREDASWDSDLGLIVNLPGILFYRTYLRTLETFRLIVDGKLQLIVQWDARWNPGSDSEASHHTRTFTSERNLGFGILLVQPLRMEVDDGTDVAFFAQVCKVLGTDQHGTRLRLLRRVRIYRLEYLKQHPDIYYPPKDSSVPNAEASGPSFQEDKRIQQDRKAIRHKIWHQDESEIAQGAYRQEETCTACRTSIARSSHDSH